MRPGRLLSMTALLAVLSTGCLFLFHDPDGSTSAGGSGSADTAASVSASNATSTTAQGSSGAGSCEKAGGSCVAALPLDWKGPIVVTPNPTCEQPTRPVLVAGTGAPDGEQCACTPGGTPCAPPAVTLFDNATCAANASAPAQLEAGACIAQDASVDFDVAAVKVTMLPSSTGVACVHDDTEMTPAITYEAPQTFCQLEGSCDEGKVCSVGGNACIYRVGAVFECPEPYTKSTRPLLTGAMGCDCDVLATAGCSGTIDVSIQDDCSDEEEVAIDLDTCQPLSAHVPGPFLKYAPTDPGTCSNKVWKPSLQGVTLCCLP